MRNNWFGGHAHCCQKFEHLRTVRRAAQRRPCHHKYRRCQTCVSGTCSHNHRGRCDVKREYGDPAGCWPGAISSAACCRRTLPRWRYDDLVSSAPNKFNQHTRHRMYSQCRLGMWTWSWTKSFVFQGCSLYKITTYLLLPSFAVSEATRSATAYTHLGIETAFLIGQGNNPLNLMHSIAPRIIPQ